MQSIIRYKLLFKQYIKTIVFLIFYFTFSTSHAINTILQQDAYIKASNTEASDEFGRTVAISGDYMVIGAPNEDSGNPNNQFDNTVTDSGAAYVYKKNTNGVWNQVAYLKSSVIRPFFSGGKFGRAVAIDDTTIAVTSGWDVTFFTLEFGNWVYKNHFTSLFTPISGTGSTVDNFGSSVAISGDTVVVGAIADDSNATGINGSHNDFAPDSGAAYVLVRSGDEWFEQAFIKPHNTGIGDAFGTSVDIDSDTIVIGARNEDSNATGVDGVNNDSREDSGAAYVFTRIGTTWSQQAYLKPSTNENTNLDFGYAVSISGDLVVVGAIGEKSGSTGINGDETNSDEPGSGAAYAFTRNASNLWSQDAYIKASNTDATDNFGRAVDSFSDGVDYNIIIGAPIEFSSSTGVNGDQSNNDVEISGAAYIFTRSADQWQQTAYLKASNTGDGDFFGSVAITGQAAVVGAIFEDSNATGVNGADNNLAPDSGAAYTFNIKPIPIFLDDFE